MLYGFSNLLRHIIAITTTDYAPKACRLAAILLHAREKKIKMCVINRIYNFN